jgi:hypothetical protein
MATETILLKARQRISGGRAAKQVGLISGSSRAARGRLRAANVETPPNAAQK